MAVDDDDDDGDNQSNDGGFSKKPTVSTSLSSTTSVAMSAVRVRSLLISMQEAKTAPGVWVLTAEFIFFPTNSNERTQHRLSAAENK